MISCRRLLSASEWAANVGASPDLAPLALSISSLARSLSSAADPWAAVRERIFGSKEASSSSSTSPTSARSAAEILRRPLKGFDLVHWNPQNVARFDPLWEDPGERLRLHQLSKLKARSKAPSQRKAASEAKKDVKKGR